MKIDNKRIRDISFAVLGLAFVITLIAFVDDKTKVQKCQGLEVIIDDNNEQAFVSANDIKQYLTRGGSEPLIGKVLNAVNLSTLEERVKEIKQIQYSEVYGDLKGMVYVKVTPYIPFARILGSGRSKDRYVDEKGNLFPMSKYFTARVPVLSGSYFTNKTTLGDEANAPIMEFIKTISENEFWNAQIAHMHISNNGQIVLVPVLGNHIIEFGKAENVETKLAKLEVFYKQILPVKGWDTFKKVKVQYDHQIVCE